MEHKLHAAFVTIEQLEQALISNRRIGMALGIIMCSRSLTEDQALQAFITHSQAVNRPMRHLAGDVIASGGLLEIPGSVAGSRAVPGRPPSSQVAPEVVAPRPGPVRRLVGPGRPDDRGTRA